ncbi:hypothetical protein [Synechococcus sp. RS9916]|uniref:hypothetical protein n=1 Tax=Synechococcus sp. RS9916 TaxID=221359 RepID=UPI0000E54716|nr:hypothetical protein [Synechococcus sp. RS9916]EAU72873.1 hypothetical protein RS9916_40096 [Synechococcus sp. RS9916]
MRPFATMGTRAVNHRWVTRTAQILATGVLLTHAGIGASSSTPTIGRLQRTTAACNTTATEGSEQRCDRIQLDRKTDSVLRVRFIGPDSRKGITRMLTFVATDAGKDLPITCRNGLCQLSTTAWEGPVMGAAEAFSNGLGIAEGLPRAWPAKGICKINSSGVECHAQLSNGLTLRAEAKL